MPALNSPSLFQRLRRILLALLVGVLFLTNSAFVKAQEQSSDPHAKQLPANGVRSQLPQALAPAQGATAANIINDPSFEASYNSGAYWSQYSENFGTPLCIVADCDDGAGTAGPRSGFVWAWFGGVDFSDPDAVNPEFAFLQQPVTIPSCGATLKFYLWIGAATPGSGTDDAFIVQFNSTQLFKATAANKAAYPSYNLVTVNIPPGAYAPGSSLYFFSDVSDQLVTFNLDDISLVPNCLILSGNAGVDGATISYTGGSTTSSLSGDYSFNVPVGWSGAVIPTKTNFRFTPANRTYSNITTQQFHQDYTATRLFSISGNTGVGGVTLSYTEGTPKTVTSQPNGNYSLFVPDSWGGTVTPTHPCFSFNPINQSYGIVTGNLTAQNYTPSFLGGTGCADIDITVGGAHQGRFALTPAGSTRVNFAGLNNGPVQIESTNAIPLIAAERLIYKFGGVNTSFTEMMGLPDSQLDNTYWLPWYNNVDLDTQLRIGNVSNSAATVHIFIGGNEVTPLGGITLPVGGSARLSYTGVNNGPVQIVSDQNIVAAERLIYKFIGKNTSFSETMALPNSQLDNTYWLPWYNNVDLDTQLRIGNVSNAEATVHIFIGGAEVTPVDGITLPAGGSTRLSYAGMNNGPVQIISDQNIVAAERLIYKVNGMNTSFTEMMALPNSSLNTTYWLPWYNNVDLDTQLRFANVSNATATVHVYIGGSEMNGSPFTLSPGESRRQSFPGVNSGPVQIVSNVNIVAAERLIYKAQGVNTSFSEMMALPDSQLDNTYWLPWYNNVDLDTQLRFGVP